MSYLPLSVWKNPHRLIIERNVVTTLLVPSFLDGSSSFLQIIRPTVKARMGLNFGKTPSLTALERQKN